MENEFNKKYKVNKEYMERYPEIISRIYKRIINKNIDITELLEKYKSGMGIEHIKAIFKLTEEELEYIISKYVSEAIETNRKNNLDKWSKIHVEALPKDDLEGYKPPKNKVEAYVNLQEAIKRVEGDER